jgi:serine protease inhibitor
MPFIGALKNLVVLILVCELAGITAVVMVATSAHNSQAPQPFYMKADRPFFYAIYDKQTGSILLMVVMNKAGGSAS